MKVRSWWIGVGLLLGLWATRVGALELLPLHNDEGLHLTRAVEVWHLHPFWAINDGKIINHWLIAAFYPQHEAAFAGRIATVLVSLVGLAAGYALTRRVIGSAGAFLTGMLWIANPYLFFYERLAFSDAEAGALALAALWAAWRTRAGTGWRGSVLTGVLLGLAALFKFTAVPYAASVALILLVAGGGTLRERALRLAVVGLVTAACFVVPLAYLAVRGDDFFGIALGWIGGSGEGQA
ncbi:MAG: glycosyltransferase family 39 protein, partial [Anaerolineae bacterium]|nr:glycosyltransferase family 39 protein [Anaerolineae bacterium]